MKEIMYAEFADEIQELLRHTHEIVVATCDKNRITARTVYCQCDGLQIYFITSKAYTKYKQLLKNPQVALAINQLQIEGTAQILGHPASEENASVRQLCEQDPVYQEYYHQYSKYKNSVFIRIRPQVITVYYCVLWKRRVQNPRCGGAKSDPKGSFLGVEDGGIATGEFWLLWAM